MASKCSVHGGVFLFDLVGGRSGTLRSSTNTTSSARMVSKLTRRASNGSNLMRPRASGLTVTQRFWRTWPPRRTLLAWMSPGYRL